MTTTASQIRNFAKANSPFTPQACMAHIGVSGDAFWGSFKDFISRCEIVRGKDGFEYSSDYVKPKRGYMYVQVTKAMRISGTFTADDITMLTMSDKSYVHRLIKNYLKDKLIVEAGKREAGRKGSYVTVYRVIQSDRLRELCK